MRPAAASDNPAAQNHVLNLHGRNDSEHIQNLYRNFPYPILHIINPHIKAAENNQ